MSTLTPQSGSLRTSLVACEREAGVGGRGRLGSRANNRAPGDVFYAAVTPFFLGQIRTGDARVWARDDAERAPRNDANTTDTSDGRDSSFAPASEPQNPADKGGNRRENAIFAR